MPLTDLVKDTVETGTPPPIENLGIMGMSGEGIKVIPKIIGAIIHRLAMVGQFTASISGDEEFERAFGAISRKASGIGKGVSIEDVKGFISTLADTLMKGTPATSFPPLPMAGAPLTSAPVGTLAELAGAPSPAEAGTPVGIR